ncbi:MAG: hypothetical protein QM737_07075 [Ferruginibacter sp.]
MKKLFFSFCLVAAVFNSKAQLVTTPLCPPFEVHLLEGNVSNILDPTSSAEQVKQKFPCFSSEVAENDSTSKCGGLVSFKDEDIYFYTSRDYIEIGEHFKGKLSIPAMGAARGGLFQWLGAPKIKDVKWDAYQTAYGILIVHYNDAGKVNLIQFSKKSAQTIKLCQ